jgi:hypothetical protein
MKVQQVSVFLENKPGRLSGPCRILAKAGLNIITLSLADTDQFGILRLVLNDPQKALKLLKDAGFVATLTDVVAVEVDDQPGGIEGVLEMVEQPGINVEYMYAFTEKRENKAVLILRFEDPDKAVEVLQKKGVNILRSVELFERAE